MLIDVLKTDTCNRVKYKKGNGNDGIIDTIHQECMSRSPHIRHSLAMYDKGGDVPRHHKHTHRATQQEHAHKVDLAQVLGCQQ